MVGFRRLNAKLRKTIADVLKAVAGLAAVVFLLAPIGTWNQVLLCGISIVVAIICVAISSNLSDDDDADGGKSSGYWPSDPIDWNRKSEPSDER